MPFCSPMSETGTFIDEVFSEQGDRLLGGCTRQVHFRSLADKELRLPLTA